MLNLEEFLVEHEKKKKHKNRKKKTTLGLVDKYAQQVLLFLDYAYFFF